jgi:hypothetical protein
MEAWSFPWGCWSVSKIVTWHMTGSFSVISRSGHTRAEEWCVSLLSSNLEVAHTSLYLSDSVSWTVFTFSAR